MFHKFRKPIIHGGVNLVWPLRFVFVLVAIYFAMEVSDILQSGVANYKYSDDAIRGENDFRYWVKVVEKFVFSLFFIVLAFFTKSKKNSEQVDD